MQPAQPSDTTFPLRQGHLDWFCSLYAIINDVQLRYPGVVTYQTARVVFKQMILAVQDHRDGNLAGLAADGLDPVDFPWLADQATHAFDALGCAPRFKPAATLSSLPTQKICVAFLQEATTTGHGLSHYTVLKTHDRAGTYELTDSDGYQTLVKRDNGDFDLTPSPFSNALQQPLRMTHVWSLD